MPATILRPFRLIFRNRHFAPHGKPEHVKSSLILGLITLIVMLCIFLGMVMIVGTVTDDPFFKNLIPEKLIELIYYTFFFLLLISNAVATIGNVYVSENMNLLLSTPVSTLRLYTAKVLQALFETGLIYVIFIVPTLLAFEFTLDLKPGFPLAVLLVSIPMLLIPAGLGMVVGTIFVRLASFFWKRGLLLFFCLALALGKVLTSLLEILKEAHANKGAANVIVRMIGLFHNPSPPWLPSQWAGDVLIDYIGVERGDTHLKYLLLFGTTLGSLALGYLVFDLFGLRARSAASTHHSSERGRAHDYVRHGLEFIFRHLPLERHIRAIMLKDLSSLVRDRAQALQLLLYVSIIAVYMVVYRFLSVAMNFTADVNLAWRAILASINVLISGMILTTMMTRLVYPSVSLEGRAFWIMQVTPMSIEKLIRAKFWCWLPLTSSITITLLLIGSAATGAPLGTMLYNILIGLFFSIGFTGLAIGTGALYASFDWESPTQISYGLGTLVLLLLSLVFLLFLLIPSSAITILSMVPETRLYLGSPAFIAIVVACMLVIATTSILVARSACTRGAAALTKKLRA